MHILAIELKQYSDKKIYSVIIIIMIVVAIEMQKFSNNLAIKKISSESI